MKKVIIPIVFVVVGIILFWQLNKHVEQSARVEAEAFYATLQVGAPFDRADFERQIAAKGGRVANFDNIEQAQSAIRKMRANDWRPIEVMVVTKAVTLADTGAPSKVVQYYTNFYGRRPGWSRWLMSESQYEDDLGTRVSYCFEVFNGKIDRKMVHEEWQWREFR
jgi:hypothetical protein